MPIQRLVLDTVTEDDYELIAIHCSLASYKVAYVLNKQLNLRLFRKKEDINFEYDTVTAHFPLFQYYDHFQYNMYNLLGNKYRIQTVSSLTEGLFSTVTEDIVVTKYLIPELKDVDYFLKIEAETYGFSSKLLIAELLNIPQIVTAYSVDYTQIKSKNNLIIE